jgi:fructose/tagatose bisphosphate aldolase
MLLDARQAAMTYRLAREQQFALLAINADSPAAIVDCLEAAKRCDAPVIIETSLWQLQGRSFGAGNAALGMARYLADVTLLAEAPAYRDVPVIFHTDHIKGPETIPLLTQAIAGFPLGSARLTPSSVSLDSSAMSEDENIATLCRLCREADALRATLTLEMEAGVDDGITDHATTERLLRGIEEPHPGRLALYAPGAGTRHGYSADGFPGFQPSSIAAHAQLAERICGRPIGIALHGSSGLSDQQLRDGVAAGVCKVNWSSDSLHLRSQAAHRYWHEATPKLARDHAEFKITAMDTGMQDAIAASYIDAVVARMTVLGGVGEGARVRKAIATVASEATA